MIVSGILIVVGELFLNILYRFSLLLFIIYVYITDHKNNKKIYNLHSSLCLLVMMRLGGMI